jgi:hypothetical protein
MCVGVVEPTNCSSGLVSTLYVSKYLSPLIFTSILIVHLSKKIKYIFKLYYIINYIIFHNFNF